MKFAALRRLGLWVLALAWATSALADPTNRIAPWVERASDDPRAMAQALTHQALAQRGAERAWTQLGLSIALQALENHDAALAALGDARAHGDRGDPAFEHFLALRQLAVAQLRGVPEELLPKTLDLQRQLEAAHQPVLACLGLEALMWLQTETRDLDQAWRSAEALERCARPLGMPTLEAKAVVQMGLLVARSHPEAHAGVAHLQRALELLDRRPARLVRANIAWEIGHAVESTEPDRALTQYALSEHLSREIHDDVGVAVAQLDAAALLRLRGPDEARALSLARQARNILIRADSETRTANAYEIIIEVLARRKDPSVVAEIQAAQRWINPSLSPGQHARLLAAMAQGYAAMGRFREAYEVERQVKGLMETVGNAEVRTAALQFQARYDAARREAENAELRHREEAQQLRLAAVQDRQAALLAMLAAVAMAAGLAIWFAWRALRQRRSLVRLALRDELTGLPNRRALAEMGLAILGHSRHARLPVAVGLIDLDHFKRVNDTYGHDVGDEVLKAFASVLAASVRDQDAAGRWGGEEFLVVLQGTDETGMAQLFDRLRAGLIQAEVKGMPVPHQLSFSMGGVVDRHAEGTLETLSKRADEQLYGAKEGGRDRLCMASRSAEALAPVD